MATWQYSRRVKCAGPPCCPQRQRVLQAPCRCLDGHGPVARLTAPPKVLPLVLLAVLAYTPGQERPGPPPCAPLQRQCRGVGGQPGGPGHWFYDGFFGPGTGSFFVFLFVRLLGYDFLNASASAKLLNCATNIAAISLFAFKGPCLVALRGDAGHRQCGGQHGRHAHGAQAWHRFVRGIFIVVVSSLILKTGYDAFPALNKRWADAGQKTAGRPRNTRVVLRVLQRTGVL